MSQYTEIVYSLIYHMLYLVYYLVGHIYYQLKAYFTVNYQRTEAVSTICCISCSRAGPVLRSHQSGLLHVRLHVARGCFIMQIYAN